MWGYVGRTLRVAAVSLHKPEAMWKQTLAELLCAAFDLFTLHDAGDSCNLELQPKHKAPC